MAVCRKGGCGDPAAEGSEWCGDHEPPAPPELVDVEGPSYVADPDRPVDLFEVAWLTGVGLRAVRHAWEKGATMPDPDWPEVPAWRLDAIFDWATRTGRRWPLDVEERLGRLPDRGRRPWPAGDHVGLVRLDRRTGTPRSTPMVEGDRQREFRERIRYAGLPPGDRRHGTLYGYAIGGCRCERCREANAAHARDWRASRRARR